MGRELPPTELTEVELRDLAKALRDIAATLDAAIEKMQEHKAKSIWPKHWQSAKNAIPEVVKFASYVMKEAMDAQFSRIFAAKDQKSKPKRPKAKKGPGEE